MQYITGLWLLLVSFFVSWWINWAFKHVVPKLVKKTRSDTDDRIADAIRIPLTTSVVLGTVLWLLNVYLNDGSTVLNFIKLVVSILSVWWVWVLIKVNDAIVDELDHRLNHKHDIMSFFKSLSRWLWLAGGILLILIIWEIDITPLLAAGGVVGIAVAFAAKDTIANIFGGISVFLDKPYKVGDYIVTDLEERGEVVSIGARTTKIKTRDDVLISIPNSIMSNTKIVNETGLNPPLRIRIMVGMPYDCDLEKAEKTLFIAISSVEKVLDHPEPRVRYREFGDSAINAEVMGWVKNPADKGKVSHQVIKSIHSHLSKAKIVIPYPQRDVHLYPLA